MPRPTSTVIFTLAVALAVAISPATSWSQAKPAENEAIAKRHYQLGAEYYRAKRYADALEQFKKAHELTALPALVFNIGRCHERLGQNREAIDHYERFLRTLDDPRERAKIERRLVVLRAKVKAATPGTAAPVAPRVEHDTPGSAPDPVQAPPPAAPSSSEPTRWKKTAGWVALGLGAATRYSFYADRLLIRLRNGGSARTSVQLTAYRWTADAP